MIKLLFVAIMLTTVSGCGFRLTEIQQGINGGVRYSEGGGETFSSDPSGHYEKRGDYYIGGDIRFIYTR